jgi:PTS system fructose-specific IIC component
MLNDSQTLHLKIRTQELIKNTERYIRQALAMEKIHQNN